MSSQDILIVGSGAAGLTAALNLARERKLAVIAKGALGDSASARAQGGIAAVLEEGDSFEAHVRDTMIAGAGLNDIKVVEHVVEEAPRAIRNLIDLGLVERYLQILPFLPAVKLVGVVWRSWLT